jgi:hypothetical protein
MIAFGEMCRLPAEEASLGLLATRDPISNYREVTWRVVIPCLIRVSRLSEIQSIASGLSSCFSLQNDTMLTIVT